MIEIKIPKEIRTYKEKFLFGLTFRQTVCAAVIFLINEPLYFWLSDHLGKDIAGWAVIVTATPLALIGFIMYNGMHFEKLARCIFLLSFTAQKRPYHTENIYHWLAEECKKGELENHDAAICKKRKAKKEKSEFFKKTKEKEFEDSTT